MLSLEKLAALHWQFSGDFNCRVRDFNLGGTEFKFGSEPFLVGVINLSPDSWYRESVCTSYVQAIRRARQLKAQGASIIDIGVESTLARAERVSPRDHRNRITEIVRTLSEEGHLISVETYSFEVAAQALKSGAKVLNMTGTQEAQAIYRLAAQEQAAVIICFVQGQNVRDVGDLKLGGDPIATMCDYFSKQIAIATQTGLENLIIDPGLGFYYKNLQDGAARVRYQMETFLNTFRLRKLGCPVCHALPHAFEFFGEEVRCAEPFFAVLATLGKTDLLRTHEVAKVKGVLDTLRCFG